MNSWDGEGQQEPYHTDEIEALSQAIRRSGRRMVLSLSPGAAKVGNARHLQNHAHMWRISCDFWDDWESLKRQFPRCATWALYQSPGAWPDADMLPLGRIGIRGEIGEARNTNFTPQEQRTLMTLWCIFRSPLMFGGNLPESDSFTLELISNPEVLEVNQAAINPREVRYIEDREAVWCSDATSADGKYIALFNLSDESLEVACELTDLELGPVAKVRDLWRRTSEDDACGQLRVALAPHDAAMFRLVELSGN